MEINKYVQYLKNKSKIVLKKKKSLFPKCQSFDVKVYFSLFIFYDFTASGCLWIIVVTMQTEKYSNKY